MKVFQSQFRRRSGWTSFRTRSVPTVPLADASALVSRRPPRRRCRRFCSAPMAGGRSSPRSAPPPRGQSPQAGGPVSRRAAVAAAAAAALPLPGPLPADPVCASLSPRPAARAVWAGRATADAGSALCASVAGRPPPALGQPLLAAAATAAPGGSGLIVVRPPRVPPRSTLLRIDEA